MRGEVLIYIILSSLLHIACSDLPLAHEADSQPEKGPVISLGDTSGDIHAGYVLQKGSITFDFSQDKAGYYNIQVLDSSDSYVSGSGVSGWMEYNIPNEVIKLTVYSPNSSSGHDTYFNGSGDFTLRIRSRDLNSNEKISEKYFTVAPPDSIIIEGAGAAEVNGCYERIAPYTFIYNGEIFTVNYKKSGASYYISVDDIMPGSHIHYSNSFGYIEYYYIDNMSVPPSLVQSDWRVAGSGSLPKPTFYLNN